MSGPFSIGRAAWPALALSEAQLSGYLAERGVVPDAPHVADLYLACACAHGVAGAVAVAHSLESQMLRAQYRPLFAAAFAEALASM